MDYVDARVNMTLEALVNRGKFMKARRVAEKHIASRAHDFEDADKTSAHVLFNLALTTALTGGDAEPIWEACRTAPDYDPFMEGDILRDQLLHGIRTGNLSWATSLSERIRALHSTDQNRMAVFWMAQGRLQLARGYVHKAVDRHMYADSIWLEMRRGNANEVWQRNNNFHFLRALAAAGEIGSSREGKVFFEVKKDPSWKRRLRARLLHRGGRTGFKLDRLVERLVS